MEIIAWISNYINIKGWNVIIRPCPNLLMHWKYCSLTLRLIGWVQDCSISTANAVEILQSCTKPSTCSHSASHHSCVSAATLSPSPGLSVLAEAAAVACGAGSLAVSPCCWLSITPSRYSTTLLTRCKVDPALPGCSPVSISTVAALSSNVGRRRVPAWERYVGGRDAGESPASVGGNVICNPGRMVLARDLYVGGGELGRL